MVESEEAEARTATSDQFGKLFKAVAEGKLIDVKSIIESDFSAQAFRNLSSTLLHQAANKSHSQILQYLLQQHGAYVDGGNAQQMTALHVSAHVGDVRSIRVLLLNDANVNEVDYDNRTPLYFAVYDGHYECVKEILTAKNVDLEITRNGGWTHLHEAARFGHYECMKLLMDHRVNLMAKTEDAWWTPGHMAACSGRYDCLKLLIESEIDVNVGGGPHHTSTLLHEACYNGHTEVVKLLLENGANPSLYDGHGLPHHIATRCGHPLILDILLNYFKQNPKYARLTDAFTNVDPTSNPLSYHNALHMASLYDRKECLQVLLKHKAKHLPNGMHQYPVMLAAFKMNMDCLKILLHEIKMTWLNTGDNVLQSEGHYSALHHLCIKTYKTNNKSIACACLLLNSGMIDINQYDDDWEVPTCLFLAARNGDIGMVQYLLNSGANPRLCGSLTMYLLNNPKVKQCSMMIDEAREEPMSLLLLSKLTIRATLYENSGIDCVDGLPLPNYLKKYVLHGHYHGIVECL